MTISTTDLTAWTSILIAVVAVVVSVKSALYARKSVQLSALQRLAEQGFSQEFNADLDLVIRQNHASPAAFFRAKETMDAADVARLDEATYQVMRFFDMVGFYADQGIIDRKHALELFGSMIVNAWAHLKFLADASELPKDSFPNHFRRLAKCAEGKYEVFEVAQKRALDNLFRGTGGEARETR
jgi:hypothetical protein